MEAACLHISFHCSISFYLSARYNKGSFRIRISDRSKGLYYGESRTSIVKDFRRPAKAHIEALTKACR